MAVAMNSASEFLNGLVCFVSPIRQTFWHLPKDRVMIATAACSRASTDD